MTVRDAITYLHRFCADSRKPEALNALMVSLAPAAMGDRSIKIAQATDMLEQFLGSGQFVLAA